MNTRKIKNILYVSMLLFVVLRLITKMDIFRIAAGVVAIPTLILLIIEFKKTFNS